MAAHWVDGAAGLLASRGKRFFTGGWGDPAVLDSTRIEALLAPAAALAPRVGAPEPLAEGVLVRQGEVESPMAGLLPSPARLLRLRWLLPARGEPTGVLLSLAASGDQGFSARTRLLLPLVRRGLSVVLPETPYYGRRRPPDQAGAAVRRVSDLVLMALATVREGQALLSWLRATGHDRLGVSGFSMGGQMSAVIAATLPFPLAAIPLAPSDTPAGVFTLGAMRRLTDLDALRREGETREDARAALAELLGRFRVTALPPPRRPEAAVVVGTARDGMVPPEEMARIAAHWGAELRWLKDGHVTAWVRRHEDFRRAIEAAFQRL